MNRKKLLIIIIAAVCIVALAITAGILEFGAKLKVTFDLNYADSPDGIQVQRVDRGAFAAEPERPVRDGYVFVGWFTEKQPEYLTDVFLFEETKIEKNTRLYAAWRIDNSVFSDFMGLAMTDTDGDGLADEYEDLIGTDKERADTDGDGVDDHAETVILATDATNPDSDGNGKADGEEDADGDGIINSTEQALGTHLLMADTDLDGIPDGKETEMGLDPLNGDTDGDGASDEAELYLGTDPLNFDALFTDSASAATVGEKGSISVSVEAKVEGALAGSVTVTPVSVLDFPAMSATIPGYMGSAFELSAHGAIDSALLTFDYDAAFGKLGEDFQPRVFYYNEETCEYEELPDQTVTEGRITVKIDHFSYYGIFNSAEFFAYTGTPAPFGPEMVTTELADYYDAIYYGRIPTTDNKYPFVGFDLRSDRDYDGDGLDNAEELEIVINKAGNPVVLVHSNPVLKDSDLDGIEDLYDDFPLKYSLKAISDVRSLLNNSLYAASGTFDQIYYTDYDTDDGDSFKDKLKDFMYVWSVSDKRTWNEMMTFFGWTDYGTQKMIFKQVWIEYLADYCDVISEQLADAERGRIQAETFLSAIDNCTSELADLLDDYETINSVREAVASETWVALLNKRNSILKNGIEKADLNALAKNFDQIELHAKVNTFSTASVDDVAGCKLTVAVDIGAAAISGFSEVERLKTLINDISVINANMQVYDTVIEILEQVAALSNDDAARSGAKELISELRSQINGGNEMLKAAKWDQAGRVGFSALCSLASEALITLPVEKAILSIAELGLEKYTTIANKQNKIIANEFMLRAAASVLSRSTKDVNGQMVLYSEDDAASVYATLGQICNLRLNGEILYAELWGEADRLLALADRIEGRAERIGVDVSQKIVQHCRHIADPNMTVKVIVKKGGYQISDFDCAVFVDGAQLVYASRKGTEISFHAGPGTHKVTVVVSGERDTLHSRTYSIAVLDNGKGRGEFTFDIAAESINFFQIVDKETKQLLEATVLLRRGLMEVESDSIISFVFNKPNKHNHLQSVKLPVGDYTAEVVMDGYDSFFTHISAKPLGDTYVFELTNARENITGTVVNENGVCVPGATVSVMNDRGETVATASSGADGAFALRAAIYNYGQYYLQCKAEGYEEYKERIYGTKNGQMPDLTITLEPLVKPTDVIAEGNMGAGIGWTLTAGGTLTLSGSGKTQNYGQQNQKNQPWAEHFEKIRAVVIGEGITSLGWYNFAHCTNLKTVVFPSSLSHLGYGTFLNCTGLETINIPDTVTAFGWDVFFNCRGLKNVTLSKNLVYMEGHIFCGCISLESITFPATLKEVTADCFENCPSLKTVYFEGKAPAVDGKAFPGIENKVTLYYIEGMPGWSSPQWTCDGVTYKTATYVPKLPADGSMLGSGTAEDPYQVRTAQHLDMVRNDLKAHYIQMNDIDLSVFESFLPIGKADPGGVTLGVHSKYYDYGAAWFEGSYDGNGFVIRGLKIDQTELDCVGLFSGVSEIGKLQNIIIEDAFVYVDKAETDYVSFFEEYGILYNINVGVLVGTSYGRIENCAVSGNLTAVNGCRAMTGGVAGRASSVIGCDSRVNIYAKANRNYRFGNVFGEVYCGGIVGFTHAISSAVKECRNYGDVCANGGRYVDVGGISGHMGYVVNCINYGNVIGKSDIESMSVKTELNIGGIVGYDYGGYTENSINLGSVTSECVAGSAKEFVIKTGGIIGKSGLFGNGSVVDCLNGGKIIDCVFVEKTNADGSPIKYEKSIEAHRIVGDLGGYNRDKHRGNYSLKATIVCGELPRDLRKQNEFNGEDIPEQEFDRRLKALEAIIEQK